MWGTNKEQKEQLENELMKIQAKNGIICLKILGTITLTTLTILIGNDLGITNFILEKINDEIENYQIETIQMQLPKKYQNIDIILEKPDEEGELELTKQINQIYKYNRYDYD